MATENNSSKYLLLDENRGLAGFYNFAERERKVLATLSRELSAMQTLDFNKDQVEQPVKTEERTIASIKADVENLYEHVRHVTFEGQHFTKQYRTLEGHCEKLLKDLDNYSGSSADNQMRVKLIDNIHQIFAMLRNKVHPSGNCCESCELYNTLWQ